MPPSSFLAGFFLVSPAKADFHMVQIEEVHAGSGGNANIQFIEINMSFSPGQNCQGTGNHIDFINLFSPCDIDGFGARLVFFDATGNQTGEFIFPGNTPIGELGRSILIGTQQFADLSTAPEPDFIMPANVVPNSGRVCYKEVPGALFGVILCLSYGAFTGDTEGFGPPAPALPVTGNMSLKRAPGSSSGRSSDFALGTPAPRNNAGVEGTIPALLVTKSDSPDPARTGDDLTYTIIVSNTAEPATGVIVTDTLPAGVTFVSASPTQGSCSGRGTIICSLGDLPTGAVATVMIRATAMTSGQVVNTAVLDSNEFETNTASVTTTVCGTEAFLRLTGTVTRAKDPIRGARVTLRDPSGCTPTQTTRTNARGKYRFTNLADGTYNVTASKRKCRFRHSTRTVAIAGRNGNAKFTGSCR